MKAITIWQPYASLLAVEEKKYETRSWATSYRGPIAIHAAKRPVRQIMDALAHGTADQRQAALLMERLCRRIGGVDHLHTGEVVGMARMVRCNAIDEAFISKLTPQELALGDFTPGRYAWEFEEMVFLDHPLPATGKQGLWDYYGTLWG